jgi:cell division protein ZapE
MEFDAAQQIILTQFNQLKQDLIKFQGWRTWFCKVPKGIYCWGSVGRGKTLLMDLFFENLPRKDKMRMHFHAFMQHVHTQMFLKPHQNDPLTAIARDFSAKTKILCLDEMMVDDVADAMILARLLKALHHFGVVLVFTSNTNPDDLYRNGVQRQNFLPAIKMIQENTHVVSIGNGQDYRIKTLSESGVFFTPLSIENEQRIQEEFNHLTNNTFESNKTILIHGREFISQAIGLETAWFSFAELCQKPRAYPDYLILAEQFKSVFITGMPICRAVDDSAMRRFIHLIDVLYDKKIILILSAAADVFDLYQGTDLKKEFTRTQSRLMEMRTLPYWNRQLNL